MTFRGLLARNLLHYRAIHGAVALGVGVGAAVLAGALIVGTSVRGSLRDLTLDRLGSIDFAAVGERYFRSSAAAAVGGAGSAAAAILLRGSAEHADTGARAARVRVHGVDEAFWRFFDSETPELGPREIALNRRLADELGAAEGESVLLRLHSDTLIPAESVMGRKADTIRLLRLRVAAVLANSGPGRFGLSPQQQLPYNAFVSRETLQRVMELPGRANALFVAGGALESAAADWRAAFGPEDARLSVRALPDSASQLVESERIVLDRNAVAAVRESAQASGLAASEVLTYLANSIAATGRSVPYSTVTALQETPDSLRLVDGSNAPDLEGDEILLNEWAASDLGVRLGEPVALTYYVVGEGSRLETSTHEFRLAGILRMAGAALDRDYAPTYKGMTDQDRMADWDPPFPIDLRLIRPRDERYWERYRAAPKAFVALDTAKELWTSRFGQLTSLRLAPESEDPADPLAARLRANLRDRLDPADFGLALQPVKRIGLEASAGATDFSGLFVGFSMFLIASAAILVALLFRLGVERRSREIGTLLAVGHSPGSVRRTLLAEGAVLAACGCLIGIPGAVAYSALMIYGLNTWWSGAVGTSLLGLHVQAADLIAGGAFASAIMLGSIWLALRRLVRLSPRALLAGNVEPVAGTADRERKARRLRRLAIGAGVAAVALLGASLGADPASRMGAFFGVGTLCLAGGLIYFRSCLLSPPRGDGAVSSVFRLGARNGGRNPTRSVLSAALVACASFMIVTVAMNRQDVTAQEPARASGDGGFRLIADAAAPLFLDRIDEVRRELGDAAQVVPLRVRAGEDASCLNLYRPAQPSLAGVPDGFIERGGFAFQQTLAESAEEKANPWLLLGKDFDGATPVFGDMNSIMWILHLGLGDELVVQDSAGEPRRLVIAGLLSRSIFQSELLLSERRFLELFPEHSGYQTLLVESDSPDVGVALESAFADEGLDAVRTADRVAGFLVVENTYLSTFRTLGGLGLLLGTLGLAVVMVRSVLERRGELALLEALGFRQASISRLILSENALLLVLGVGIGTFAALLVVAPHLAGTAADPPWMSVALTLVAIVVLGLAAGAAAVRLTLRDPLLASLRRD